MQITEYETAIQPSMHITSDFSMELQQFNTCYSYFEQTPAQPSSCCSHYCFDPCDSSFPAAIQISTFDPAQEAFANPVNQHVDDPEAWMLIGPSMQQTPDLPWTTVDMVQPAYPNCSASLQDYPAFPDYSIDQPHCLQPSNPEVLDNDHDHNHDHDHEQDTDSLSSSDAPDMSAAGSSPEGEDSFDVTASSRGATWRRGA